MALPASLPTLEACSTGNLTRVDNVFVSRSLREDVVQCSTQPEDRPGKTDHYPITTTLEWDVERIQEEPRRNFRDVEWKAFRDTLRAELEADGGPEHVRSVDDLKKLYAVVMAAVDKAIEAHVPISNPCPHQKRWWAPELKPLVVQRRRMGRRAYR
ncbi:hypothetical protein SCHPADRAFT_790171, partial [Schizopora paradoxa]